MKVQIISPVNTSNALIFPGIVFWFEESNTLDPRINMFLKIIPGVVTEINRSSVFLSNPLFRLVFPLLPKELINSPVYSFEGMDGLGRFEIISDITFDTSNEDDLFVGSTNDDTIVGFDGNDVFVGRLGDDKLYGNDGNDTLYGESGNDILNGGLKDDILTGGTGADTFIVSEGTDQVNDFNINEGDKISFANNLSYSISQSESDLLISVDTLGNFLLKGISKSEFDPNQHILFNDDSIISGEKLTLNYIASNPDLISAFGINTVAASSHYTNYGISEGRSLTLFSASVYLSNYNDLSSAFGNDQTLALKHYIQYGYTEGRTDSSSSSSSISSALCPIGNLKLKVEPFPTVLITLTLVLCASRICLTMANPRPVPPYSLLI